jgi:uncharacterized protein
LFSFETIVAAIFALVQWWITFLLLRAAGRRWRGQALILARTAIVVFDAVLVVGYTFTFTAFLSRHNLPPRASMLLGGLTLSYLLIATFIVVVRGMVYAIDRRLPAATDPGRRRALGTAGKAVMAVPAIVLGYGSFIERRTFRVREIDLALPGLAPALDGLRLLHLSDIHLSAFLSEREFASIVDAANELHPHLAVITGDLISSRGDPLDACLRQIARIKSDAGVFGCMGNHEHYAEAEDYTAAAAARLGVRFLRSQSHTLRFGGSALNLAGVDYQRKSDGPYLQGTERLVVPDALNVLLSHNPNVLPAASERGFQLMVAGHTHGGQVAVEILHESINPARFFTPYVHGVYHAGAAAGHVTRGIGTIAIPMRLGAPPEIALLRLRKA